jgi:hypothetical protein
MARVRGCWYEAWWAVAGGDDDQNIICENEVVEILHEDKFFASDGWSFGSQWPAAVEAKVEDADVGGYADDGGQSGEDALLVGGFVVEGDVYVVE